MIQTLVDIIAGTCGPLITDATVGVEAHDGTVWILDPSVGRHFWMINLNTLRFEPITDEPWLTELWER